MESITEAKLLELQNDETFCRQLAQADDKETLCEVLHGVGIEISTEEAEEIICELERDPDDELCEEDLDDVSGGRMTTIGWTVIKLLKKLSGKYRIMKYSSGGGGKGAFGGGAGGGGFRGR